MQYRTRLEAVALSSLVVLALPAAAGAQAADSAATSVASAVERSVLDTARYRLVEVDGKPLPAQVEKEWRCHEEVTAGTLTLTGDGRWHLESATREVCGDRTKDDRDSEHGSYTRNGSALAFLDEDGQAESDGGRGLDKDIDLDDFKSGTLASDGALRVQLADGLTTLLFRR